MADDRTYLLYYPTDGRPALFDDVGHLLRIIGLVLSGEGGESVAIIVPGEAVGTYPATSVAVAYPTAEEWTQIITTSDDPIWFEASPMGKISHRKVLRQISGFAQQKIWARDGFKCIYCGKEMGEVSLTIDHFTPLELGGSDRSDNLVAACRRCNKDKGSMPPEEFCNYRGYDYGSVMAYIQSLGRS